MSSALIAGIIPCKTLYNITGLDSKRRCCNVGDFMSSSTEVSIEITHPSTLDF